MVLKLLKIDGLSNSTMFAYQKNKNSTMFFLT